jgi:hypothetical protein
MVKLSQSKMIRLGAVAAGVAVLYVLFTSYSSGKSVVMDKAEELGGTGSMAPLSDSGPYMRIPGGVAGNAAVVQGMQGRTPSSQQTYSESTLSASELLPNGKVGADWAAVNPVGSVDTTPTSTSLALPRPTVMPPTTFALSSPTPSPRLDPS